MFPSGFHHKSNFVISSRLFVLKHVTYVLNDLFQNLSVM
jgi:hypothetical protein